MGPPGTQGSSPLGRSPSRSEGKAADCGGPPGPGGLLAAFRGRPGPAVPSARHAGRSPGRG
eukprot:2241263-Lingulodinium_polyedra.AAC.1